MAQLTDVAPLWAIEGGLVVIRGEGFPVDGMVPPAVRIAEVPARVVLASARSLSVLVPPGVAAGHQPVRVETVRGQTLFIDVGRALATGVHQVDNPVFDRAGNLYATYSGSRGQQVPVSIFRVRPDGTREPFVTGLVNPTGMAFDQSGDLYVSSRFEGSVHRVRPDGAQETFATDLGVPCGLAFGDDGTLFVGDRSGTIFAVTPAGRVNVFASVPASVAAFHLAFGPDAHLYITAPTLSTYDHIYRIDERGGVEVFDSGFGRPQGLAFDASGALMVIDALAGGSGLYRVADQGRRERWLAAPGLVGVALDPTRGLVVSSNTTIYRLDVNARGRLPIGSSSS